MSSSDTTLALAIPHGRVPAGTDLSSFTALFGEGHEQAVYTISANDALHDKLQRICAAAAHGGDLYLLRDFAMLSGAEVARAAAQIERLLAEIDHHPELVRQALRFKHLATSGATSTHEEWVRFYSLAESKTEATLEDGWVYTYSADDVRSILGQASVKDDPRPDWDDEGASLEYVFGLLKSHLALLRTAERDDLAVVYGKPSEAGA
ncbi:MAG: hypothetical protein JNN03_24040 [Rubrivivax sp.]|nr:hypothetical protein [Rubrivivax sp.]